MRDWIRKEKQGGDGNTASTIDWNDVVFEVDLLKSQEINLDYILELIFENNKKTKDKATLVEDVRRVIRASIGKPSQGRVGGGLHQPNQPGRHWRQSQRD